MFTGIIEETGVISSIQKSNKTWTVEIEAKKVLAGTQIGDSISVSGICLTAVKITENTFIVDVSQETINRSILKFAVPGIKVNLERALTLSTRLGGHLVSGHIDTTGTVTKKETHDTSTVFFFKVPHYYTKYIVDKGSICIDGISLTSVEPCRDEFQVWVIPHTLSETTLLEKTEGDMVNIECDIIAKYTEKLLQSKTNKKNESEDSLTINFLHERGF